MNINKIPTNEMIVDLQESIYDASVWTAAMTRGIYFDGDGSVDARRQDNEKIIVAIEEELIRRGFDIQTIKRIEYPMNYKYDRKIKI